MPDSKIDKKLKNARLAVQRAQGTQRLAAAEKELARIEALKEQTRGGHRKLTALEPPHPFSGGSGQATAI